MFYFFRVLADSGPQICVWAAHFQWVCGHTACSQLSPSDRQVSATTSLPTGSITNQFTSELTSAPLHDSTVFWQILVHKSACGLPNFGGCVVTQRVHSYPSVNHQVSATTLPTSAPLTTIPIAIEKSTHPLPPSPTSANNTDRD